MCGIFFSAKFSTQKTQESHYFSEISVELARQNADRGPDAQNTHCITFHDTTSSPIVNNGNFIHSELTANFYASELRLRGDSSVVQPHVRGTNVLCWNGEIFEGIEVSSHENDGIKLFDLLCAADTTEDVRDIFSRIEGPYAFVFYHTNSKRLYYGRDPLGRRSLLIHKPSQDAPYLLLSSVSAGANPAYEFVELSTEHVYSLDLESWTYSADISGAFHNNVMSINRAPTTLSSGSSFSEPAKVNTTIPPEDLLRLDSIDEVPEHLAQAVDDLIFHLDRSVMLRVRDIPRHSQSGKKARVAVLFSGGIDSTILTFLAHRHIPIDEPIDLLNVAFENPRKVRIQKEGNIGGIPKRQKNKVHTQERKVDGGATSYLVPDRVTGLMEVEELRRLCPERTWNFVEVNVPYDASVLRFSYSFCIVNFVQRLQEGQNARPLVESLMAPGRTVMDLSLAMALYFASRGQGQVRKNPEAQPEPYTSEARVLINGLGSDELLGGYGRHRSVFNAGGWAAAITELQQEIDRIPTRNLGRDDRVVSSHGKESRHPFLSLSVVSFLARLPVHFKMDPRLEVSVGDKMLLRLATRKLGLIEASSRKKRAMQFGSHSARMDGERRGDVDLDIVEIV